MTDELKFLKKHDVAISGTDSPITILESVPEKGTTHDYLTEALAYKKAHPEEAVKFIDTRKGGVEIVAIVVEKNTTIENLAQQFYREQDKQAQAAKAMGFSLGGGR